MKTRIAIAAVLAFAGAALAQNGGDGGARTPLAFGAPWSYDEIGAAGVPSNFGPWEFVVPEDSKGLFRITDDFIVGDQYTAVDATIGLIGVTGFNGPQPPTAAGGDGEAAWQSGNYQTLEVSLGPGTYSITISGDGAGGLPAGFYVQLEKIPAPGTMALLGLGGLVAARRRR